MAASIDIRKATKRFGKVTALDDVSLKIDAGEFIVLLGPSGCGKTTLLRSLAGLELLDEGEIDIAGTVVFSAPRNISIPPGKRQVGMVFQSYALWPHMTVNDNIGFGLEIQKLPKAEIRHRIAHVLEDLSMGELGKRYPSELSGGQQQRVAVARLLATKPAVFLMDEPLSNLDARLRMDMRSELKRLHYDTGATTVYVTHDQMEALELATQVVVMNQGRIEQIAPPMELYTRPATVFVADFIGAPRINLLPAQIVSDAGTAWAAVEDFRIPLGWAPETERVVVGARSESIEIFTEPAPDAVEFSIYAILTNGPEQIIHARRNKTLLVIRETRDLALKMDQAVWLKFDTSAINLYDRETEKLLTPTVRH